METPNNFDMEDVIAAFCNTPSQSTVRPLGHGNINTTYLVHASRSSFVLQRISGAVFPDPLGVIENFQKISTHLVSKSLQISQEITFASPVFTLDGKLFYLDNKGEYWRGQSYIPHTNMRELVSDHHGYQVGRVLAAFHSLAADFDIGLLQDPLPGFHDLDRYLMEFDCDWALYKPSDDEPAVDYCRETIEEYRMLASIFKKAKENGIVQLQAVHGDPKVDNYMFNENGEAFGLLDLDTVGSGLAVIDLGDCLRSCCNTGGETGMDTVGFNLDICRAIVQGYFSWPENNCSKEQPGLIYDAVLSISFELGLRFFTDYIRGNVYFRVAREDENLLRAVRQFQLADDIRQREDELRDMLDGLCIK